MEIDETIHLENYRDDWVRLFQDEKHAIVERIGGSIAGIEHIGSTSVPGMTAKPVVDIMIGAADLEKAGDWIHGLNGLGYEFLGEAGVPGRLHLRKRNGNAYNVHIVRFRAPIWNDNICFREYLVAHPQEAARYSALKARIVQSGVQTLLAYSEAKRALIGELLERARSWAGRAEHD